MIIAFSVPTWPTYRVGYVIKWVWGFSYTYSYNFIGNNSYLHQLLLHEYTLISESEVYYGEISMLWNIIFMASTLPCQVSNLYKPEWLCDLSLGRTLCDCLPCYIFTNEIFTNSFYAITILLIYNILTLDQVPELSSLHDKVYVQAAAMMGFM